MPNQGRCGRKRRNNSKYNKAVSQSHLEVFIQLKKWMKQLDKKSKSCLKYLSLLEPADFEATGRGLRTRGHLNPGDTIVSIPGKCLITVETVLSSQMGKCVIEFGQQFSPQQLLSMFLLYETVKGPLSAWWPYLATLPKTYTNAVYFSANEVNLLKPRARELALAALIRFQKAQKKMSNFLKSKWSSLFPDNLQPIFPHLSDFRWAWSTVNTRSVYLPSPELPIVSHDLEESHMALAPFLDLLNHTDTAQITAGLNERTGTYDIVTQDCYHSYDQVFICYGAHDNTKLAIDYGFVLPSNSNNSVSFSLDEIIKASSAFIKTDGELERKKRIISDAKLSGKLLCSMEGCSWSLMTALQIACLPWSLLDKWKLLLQGQSVSDASVESASQIARILLSGALESAQNYYLKVISELDKTSIHYDMITHLASNDVDILHTSLEMLSIESTHHVT